MELFVQGLRSPSYQQDKKHGVQDYLVGEEHQCCVRLGHLDASSRIRTWEGSPSASSSPVTQQLNCYLSPDSVLLLHRCQYPASSDHINSNSIVSAPKVAGNQSC